MNLAVSGRFPAKVAIWRSEQDKKETAKYES
jgi:hypothetical protein